MHKNHINLITQGCLCQARSGKRRDVVFNNRFHHCRAFPLSRLTLWWLMYLRLFV